MPIPAPDSRLFTASDLGDLLQKPVTDTAAAAAESMVWGWLRGPLGLTTRPDPVPEDVFSWALELGAIALENPAGWSSYQLGQERIQFSAERRTEILREATAVPGGTDGLPRAAFPAACPYPDPARWP